MSGNRFLIETERYDGFKTALLKLLDRNVTFIEIMGHETIALGYLSKSTGDPFSNSSSIETIDGAGCFSIRTDTDIGLPWRHASTA